MKVWITRDGSGTMCAFNEQGEPPMMVPDGFWTEADMNCLTDGTLETEKMYGKGFHGVRKGRKKLFEVTLTPAKEVKA